MWESSSALAALPSCHSLAVWSGSPAQRSTAAGRGRHSPRRLATRIASESVLLKPERPVARRVTRRGPTLPARAPCCRFVVTFATIRNSSARPEYHHANKFATGSLKELESLPSSGAALLLRY